MRTIAPLMLIACTSGPEGPLPTGDTAVPEVVSFSADVAPIFAARCNVCHHPTSAGQYDFTRPFDPEVGLVGRENSWIEKGAEETVLVDPGNPENSFLLTKVDDALYDPETDGGFMPLHRPRYDQAELDAIADWIDAGAEDDAQFRDEVAPLFGTAISLGAAGGRCTGCHYPGAPNGLNVLDLFDPVEGAVDREARSGGILVVPGDAGASVLMDRLLVDGPLAMPQHPARLNAQQIGVLRRWIELGALDD